MSGSTGRNFRPGPAAAQRPSSTLAHAEGPELEEWVDHPTAQTTLAVKPGTQAWLRQAERVAIKRETADRATSSNGRPS